MLRIGAMNMILHGVENPVVEYRDSLSEDIAGEKDRYSLILANPPFAGSLDYEQTARDLQQVVKTRKTELLFLALFLRLLRTGGRAAVIVPDGVLFGSSKAHKELRRMLVEDHKLDAVISLPSGVFRPYAGVSTAILCFTKTGVGGTDHVWFYDMSADGWSLDDKRQPLLPEAKLGPGTGGAAHGRRARQEQPAGRAGPLGRARRRGAGAPAHRAELLRAEGRHRQGRCLRPLHQPLQGDGARGGGARDPGGDHRRPEAAGGGDRRKGCASLRRWWVDAPFGACSAMISSSSSTASALPERMSTSGTRIRMWVSSPSATIEDWQPFRDGYTTGFAQPS